MTTPDECPKSPIIAPAPCSITEKDTGAKLIRSIRSCDRCGWVDPDNLDVWAESAYVELLDGMSQRIAMATSVTPFAFVVQTDVPLTLTEGISQALAAASMCWGFNDEQLSAAGYDTERAKQIGIQLARLVYEEIHKAR
jgi:hypothetical protein